MLVISCQTSTQKNPVLTIEGGKITGSTTPTSGVLVYKGIPYAAPPVGNLRWREPQPVVAWEGVKAADKFGNAAVQATQETGGFYQHEFFKTTDLEKSEDCLYLNVWTASSGKTNAKLPVAMYVHGGGFVHGSGHEVQFNGEAWAKRGVILVTINYRLGAFGFMPHPLLSSESPHQASGNQGVLDMVAALQWIKDNIVQFGGDPDNVTLFGQSAGGFAVKYLCTSPLAKNLINKAIIMSAGGVTEIENKMLLPLKESGEASKKMYDFFNLTTLDKMRSYPAQDVLNISGSYSKKLQEQGIIPAQKEPVNKVSNSVHKKTKGYQSYAENMGPMILKGKDSLATDAQKPAMAAPNSSSVTIPMSWPVIDGYSITQAFPEAVKKGAQLSIPYMIGYVSNDITISAEGINAFCLLNKQQGNTTYAYEFARALPGDDAGAFHSGELWYVFNTLGRSWRPMTKADFALSERMVDYWTNFAKYGNPNGEGPQVWKPFTENKKQIFVFDINQ